MKNRNIIINNFGPINHADIEIYPFNIFMGSNSSGKSFIAKLIHCFNFKEKQKFENNLMFQNFYLNNARIPQLL